MKEISKQGIEKLIEAGIIKNSGKGFVTAKGNRRIGYYKTVNGRHRYIEDYFIHLLKELN